jgi:hypothetical protein
MGVFTVASVDDLLWKLAAGIHTTSQRLQRDRWSWRLGGHPKTFAGDNHVLLSEQAPGLAVSARLTCYPQPHRPKRPEVLFLVDVQQTPTCTEDEAVHAREDFVAGRSDQYWDVMQTQKHVTLRIRLGGLPQSRRDKPWFSEGWPETWSKQPMKQAEQARLNTEVSPLEGLLAALREAGHEDEARHIDAELEAVPWVRERLVRGDPLLPRALWIDPTHQTAEDLRFLLALIVLQERMMSDEPTRHELELWCVGYLRRRFHRLSDASAYEVLAKLQRTFVYPEDWRALLKYTAQVVRGVLSEERLRGVGGQPPQTTGLWTIPEAAAQLRQEGFTVSAPTLHRYVAEGTLPVCYDTRRRRCLDEKGLTAAMGLLFEPRIRALLRAAGFPADTAKHKLQRWKATGWSRQQIEEAALAAIKEKMG